MLRPAEWARIYGFEAVLALVQWAEGRKYIDWGRDDWGNNVIWSMNEYIIRNGRSELVRVVADARWVNGVVKVGVAGSEVPIEDWNVELGWERTYANPGELATALRFEDMRDSKGVLIFPKLPQVGWSS